MRVCVCVCACVSVVVRACVRVCVYGYMCDEQVFHRCVASYGLEVKQAAASACAPTGPCHQAAAACRVQCTLVWTVLIDPDLLPIPIDARCSTPSVWP